ncbi:MAG TPA: cytochrome c [Alphaproteobacteria bacterium]|nr:cytochrome c [Alphaproteobacteria bacterium]
MMQFRFAAIAAVLAGFTVSALPAAAQSVEAAAKERHDVMERFGEWSKTLAAAAKGAPLDAAVVKAAEDVSADMKKLPNLVPVGSGSDKLKNRAKPEIWTDMPKFVAYANEGATNFTALAAAAKAGNSAAYTEAFTKASGVCNNCHRDFRGPRPQ